ncbi:hypothetical protein ACSPX5_23390 [Pseudomonas sp. HLG18]|uniref:hypothetical protein n=1 Tax=Pseudomonas sp. HLG18 TaxID=3449277 RepID=UPI003F74A3FE
MGNSKESKITLDDFKGLKAGTVTGSLSVMVDNDRISLQARAGSDGETIFLEFEDSKKTSIIMIGVSRDYLGQPIEFPKAFLYYKGKGTGWTADKGGLSIREEKNSKYSIRFDATATAQSVRLIYGEAEVEFR